MRKVILTPEVKKTIMKLFEKGLSSIEINKKVGVSRDTALYTRRVISIFPEFMEAKDGVIKFLKNKIKEDPSLEEVSEIRVILNKSKFNPFNSRKQWNTETSDFISCRYEAKYRRCLRCGKDFYSAWAGNRICHYCSAASAKRGDSYSVLGGIECIY